MRRAVASREAAIGTGTAAFISAGAGAIAVACALLLLLVGLLTYARHWVRLAGRSRAGARSEDEVRRALAPLAAEGRRLRHSLPYQRRGDIDRVAIAPTGIAFAIETKPERSTRTTSAASAKMAAWPYRRRRRWCPRGLSASRTKS